MAACAVDVVGSEGGHQRLRVARNLLVLLELRTNPRALLEIIQRTGHTLATLLDYVRVNHRGSNIRMTQQFLDGADVYSHKLRVEG